MKIITSTKQLISIINSKNPKLSFIPTMGGLHKGHLSLIIKAKKKKIKTLVSIFVNPAQFNNINDFKKYPRNINKDIIILKKINPDFLFMPKKKDLFRDKRINKIKLGKFSKYLCGKYRRNHFTGVVDVIDRFLKIINPLYIFLGEKDYQQLQLIRQLVKDLNINVSICGVPTVRETDGLAMSSRNVYLSPDERVVAGKINVILSNSAKQLSAGKSPKKELRDAHLKFTGLVGRAPEYLELCDAQNLRIVKEVVRPARLITAVTIGKTRLIDNWPVTPVPQ